MDAGHGKDLRHQDRDIDLRGIGLDKYFRSGDQNRRLMYADSDKNLKEVLKCLSMPSEQAKGISGKEKLTTNLGLNEWAHCIRKVRICTVLWRSQPQHAKITTDAISWTVLKPTT